MGVDGESSTDFFGKSSPAVVAGGEFDVHAGSLSVGDVVLDSYVRKWDLSAHHLKPMPFGDVALALGGSPVWAEFREVVVDPLFQLVIEDNAEVPSARAFNLARGFLVETVEVRIMVSFAWFCEAVIEALIFAGEPVSGEEAVAGLRECKQLP